LQDILSTEEQADIGRTAIHIQDHVQGLQDAFSAIERLDKPVIAVIHGVCVGGGVDLISACDIRYASEDARISIREIDLAITADLGTLQRMPKVVGNHSWVRELVYTARWADSQECLRHGFFSKVLPDYASTLKAAMQTAELIAEKSPLILLGAKRTLIYSRDHSVEEGLHYVKALNGALIQSEDIKLAVSAFLNKQKPIFPKL
jgi:delta(3,5)-delta(2,4)-dienoyl-CoA isomerase